MEWLEERRLPATFVVVNTGDNAGVNPAAHAGTGTLRQALVDANATAGPDTIQFQIGSGAQTIHLMAALPILTDAVIVDGTTQPGFSGSPLIELSGSGAGAAADGLVVAGGNSTIKGLVIGGFAGNGTSLTSSGNVVTGNFIGTDLTGNAAAGNGGDGVAVFNPGNTVGGTAPGAGNVISGNAHNGVGLVAGTNVLLGNRIGTNAAGTAALGNGGDGVAVYSTDNTVGGATPAAGNLISGNTAHGVDLVGGNNRVLGNRIGTNAAGTAALGNGGSGVIVFALGNTVGGTAPGTGNLISGNAHNGVDLDGTANVVAGNLIGTDAAGAVALGNAGDGVVVFADGNTVGGTAPGAGNVISGNGGSGVDLVAGGNVVQGNAIGTDLAGTAALGNGRDGVIAYGANNTVGGSGAGAGNVIAANAGNGVALFGSGATGNVVQGNAIGTDAHGTANLGNAHDGVRVEASGNTIGGSTAAGANVIAFNQGNGIDLISGTGNAVLHNTIFGNRLQGIAQGGAPQPDPGSPGSPGSGRQLRLTLSPSGRNTVVLVEDAQTGQDLFRFVAFPGWQGGLQAGFADLTGDGTADVVAVTLGPKKGGRVRVVDGATGQPLAGPLGFFTAFHGVRGQVSIGVSDFDHDGTPDLVLTGRVGAQQMTRVYSGATGHLLAVHKSASRRPRHRPGANGR